VTEAVDDHHGLTHDVTLAQRELSTVNVLFQHAIAERIGLNPTDYRCWQTLSEAGPVPAGHLAELAGLTTSAMTGIIDRLEKAGLVRRRADPHDRRRVIIEPIQERRTEIGPLYGSLYQSMSSLFEEYNEYDLTVIRDFIRKSIGVMRVELVKLQKPEGR
jgi:DNA-binding MarR family transcriptional regulator